MTASTLIKNASIFDGWNADLIEGGDVLIEGDRIREIGSALKATKDCQTIDAGGRFLMPGLIDAHFHAYTPTINMAALDGMPKPLLVSHAICILEGSLQRGFTTVRDPGGGDIGLAMAIEAGLVLGPRFFYGGKALSQTGGHGDMRPMAGEELCNCGNYTGVMCQVVDGPIEVRKAAREELRKGAHHIKVFISGGVISPADPIWMPQFTDEELRVAVEEAERRRKYVIAHCHTDEGARRCLNAGIRSIDHGTKISPETAKMIAQSEATFVVPTLSIMHVVIGNSDKLGLSPEVMEKAYQAKDVYYSSLENCAKAGVRMGLGTDILGSEYHLQQNMEFQYRSEVNSNLDILRSATSVNAEIMQQKGVIGCIEPSALADLILVDGNPLEDISLLTTPETTIPLIMKGGVLARNDLN